MIEEANSDQQLASRVPNPETDNVFELRKDLEALTGKAMEMAESIASHIKGVEADWDKLLPVLDEVQAMLSKNCSRRKVRRAIGLPSWEYWRHWFLKESGLNVSDRTAQRRLKAFRDLMEPGPKNSAGHSEKVSSVERYQLLLAQQAANKLCDALLEGEDPSDALAGFLATNISSDRLRQLISNCPRPREASSIGVGQASSNTLFTSGAISFRFHHPGYSSKCEIEFKSGDWALLAEYITVEHREHFEAVFAALAPTAKRQAFADLALTIAKTVVHLDYHDGNLKLPAESVTVDRKSLQAA